jgi:acetate kinase
MAELVRLENDRAAKGRVVLAHLGSRASLTAVLGGGGYQHELHTG